MSVGMTIEGHQELNHMLSRLGPEVFKKDLPRATARGVKPLIKAMRENIRPHDRTGALRKSIGRRQAKYKSQLVVFQAIGPRQGFDRQHTYEFLGRTWNTTIRPTKYAHLLEEGSKPHKQPKLNLQHPGTQATFFARRAFIQTNQAVIMGITQDLAMSIPRTAARKARKRGTTYTGDPMGRVLSP